MTTFFKKPASEQNQNLMFRHPFDRQMAIDILLKATAEELFNRNTPQKDARATQSKSSR